MGQLQQIIHNGRLAAVVLAGQAIVDDALSEVDSQVVRAMCLYALEVQAGVSAGPYTEQGARAYARQALDGSRR